VKLVNEERENNRGGHVCCVYVWVCMRRSVCFDMSIACEREYRGVLRAFGRMCLCTEPTYNMMRVKTMNGDVSFMCTPTIRYG